MMLEFAIVIRVEFTSRCILNGSGISIFANRGKRHRGAVVCLMVSLKKGTAPGVLFLIVCMCDCGAILRMHGLVGLLVVVMDSAFCTLSTCSAPFEVGIISTL